MITWSKPQEQATKTTRTGDTATLPAQRVAVASMTPGAMLLAAVSAYAAEATPEQEAIKLRPIGPPPGRPLYRPRRLEGSRYSPHQGAGEKARRLRQAAALDAKRARQATDAAAPETGAR